MKIALGFFVAALVFWQCQPAGRADYAAHAEKPEILHGGIRRITEIIRHDVFSPPVASRIYAYAAVAGYEALIPGYPGYRSLAGQLNGLSPAPVPEPGKVYCFPVSSARALMNVGRTLIFSESDMDALQVDMMEDFERIGVPKDVFDRSVAFGDQVARHILQWAGGDNYNATRGAPKFVVPIDNPAIWQKTPPNFEDALEPYWNTIRPWVLTSPGQFRPEPPLPFSTEKGSAFYKEAMEVYDLTRTMTAEQRMIGWYWDDNPTATDAAGHFMIKRKKITPGGHWMNITGTVCRQQNRSMVESADAYVRVSLSLADAFISSWNEKYRANVIRPETYINRYVDRDWRPMIESPPFPEHTSGHATISAAAATALTQLFGEPFEFTDSTEVMFDLPARTFSSFHEAAQEVAMSRMYGGIHYRRGNEAGTQNGREIGGYVFKTVQTKQAD
jgi:hypothetical protein